MISAALARPFGLVAAWTSLVMGFAHADVTMEQSLSVEGAGLLNMLNTSGTVTTAISGMRSRTETDLRMESRLLRMFAGGSTAEIVQLDSGDFYSLNLKKKTFTHTTLEEQRQAIQDSIAQMREAQSSQQQGAAGVDQSDCEWSEPEATVARPGDIETIAGYRAERSVVTASQSCRDRRTGQICSFNLVLDQWLAADLETRQEVVDYYRGYAEKLGFDVAGTPGFTQRLESMFGSYQGIWNEIAEEMESAEGYPVRTTVSLAVGGPQCEADSQAQPAGATERPGMNEVVGEAIGGALGGLFGRRRDQAKKEAEPATPPPAQNDLLPDGTVRLMSITTELLSLSDGTVPASHFEVPAGFRKVSR